MKGSERMFSVDFAPVLVVSAIPSGKNAIKFLHYKSTIEIEDGETPEEQGVVEKIWTVLRYCNGYNTIQTIASMSSLSTKDVFAVVTKLVELGVMVESRKQYRHFHEITSYPAVYNWNLPQKEVRAYKAKCEPQPGKNIIISRTRNIWPIAKTRTPMGRTRFTKGRISLTQVLSICNYAYPATEFDDYSEDFLKLYVLVENNQHELRVGYYEYLTDERRLALFDVAVDLEQLKYCFDDEEMPFGSSIQIVIAADFERQAFLYSNHAYRTVLIEAGAVAERIVQFCQAYEIGAQIIERMQDVPLATELALDTVSPVMAIAIGYEDDRVKYDDSDGFVTGRERTANELIRRIKKGKNAYKLEYAECLVGDEKPVQGFWGRTFGKDGSFFGVDTVFKNGAGKMQFAGATGASFADAAFKAVIEGYERWVSGRVRVDYHGSANELDNWLDPRLIMPLTDEQVAKLNLKQFREDLALDWTLGKSYDGRDIYVPSDIVYYGQRSNGNRIYWGHSSGIAAYSDYEEAQKRALVELIERDALMRSWYSRRSPRIIDGNILPVHIKKRMSYWRKRNRKVMILEMPSDYGWVYEAVIVSDDYPAFVSGAAATIERRMIYQTMYKALEEAEYRLLLCLGDPDMTDIDPRTVVSPAGHGKVYYFEKYAETLTWLWNGRTTYKFASLPEREFGELAEMLEIVTVDMTADKMMEEESGLSVVRVFSPKLVQINFGFYSAHYKYPMLDEVDPRSLEMPHYFA